MEDYIYALRSLDLSKKGLAPFGMRHIASASEPVTAKGKGFFGLLPHIEGGMSTEISSEDDRGGFPLLAPTLSGKDVNALLSNEMSDDVYDKAQSWADMRRARGMSPFAQSNELRMPVEYIDALRKKKDK